MEKLYGDLLILKENKDDLLVGDLYGNTQSMTRKEFEQYKINRKQYSRFEMIQLINEYEASRFLGEISTPDFESWLNRKENVTI